MNKTAINTSNAPAPIGPYNQAILTGNTLYVSGQIPIDPSSGEMIVNSIEEETRMVMTNLGKILEATGCVYGVADHSVFDPPHGADVSGEHFTG